MIQGWGFSSVRPQIEGGAGRADLPFWYVRFPRYVLRDLKTWRGFYASSFGRIFHQWWITVSCACSGLLSGDAVARLAGASQGRLRADFW